MKRVLLATTALGMGAGVAFAQDAMEMAPPIALSGVAEMGVAGSKDDSVRFHTDVDVTFTMTGTTDAGVTFGTAVDLSDIDNISKTSTSHPRDTANDDDEHGGIAIHISDPDGFGTLTMGDTDGAYDWAMTEVGSGGIRSDSEHGAWNGNSGLDGKHDGQILRWDRTIGSGFSMAASVELNDDSNDGLPGGDSMDPVLGLGGTYSMPMGGGGRWRSASATRWAAGTTPSGTVRTTRRPRPTRAGVSGTPPRPRSRRARERTSPAVRSRAP